MPEADASDRSSVFRAPAPTSVPPSRFGIRSGEFHWPEGATGADAVPVLAQLIHTTPQPTDKMVPGWVVAWAALLLLAAWTTVRKVRRDGRLAPRGTWVLVSVVLLGTAFLVQNLMKRSNARSEPTATWPVVTGKVVRSELFRAPDSTVRSGNRLGGDSLRLRFRYLYQVGDASFQGDQITRDNAHAGDMERTWANRYPVGTAVAVHYNPADPSVAVLETRAFGPEDQSTPWKIVLFAVGTFLLGAWERVLHGKSGPPLTFGPADDFGQADE